MARADRVARPARTDEWEIVAADKGVSDDWDRWAKQEPNALATAYDQLSTNPTQLSSRQKRLQGKTMGTGTYDGTTFDRWQYEVTAGGRSVAPFPSCSRALYFDRLWRVQRATAR